MAVLVLGRPGLRIDGVDVSIGARPLQLVLRLAMAPRRSASAERLAHDLWGDGAGANGSLRVTVSRVRDVIGRDRITYNDGTYSLNDVIVDADSFERDLGAARTPARRVADRIADYERALQRWFGEAIDGMQELDWVTRHARRLDELREQARDEHGALLLEVGRYDQVATDLGALLRDDPTRETRCRLVALAHYRSGHQSRALEAIADTRRVLREELGLHPSNELTELEHRILHHDPCLDRRTGPDVTDDAEIEARLRAATILIRAEAFDEARAVLELADDAVEHTRGDRGAGLVALGRAQLAMSDGHEDPHPYLDEAQRIGRQLRDGDLLARAAIVRFGAGVPDDKTRALVDLTEPIPLLEPSAPVRVDLLCAGAAIVALTENSSVALQLIAEAERLHDALRSDRSQAVLLVARSIVASLDPNRFDSAVADGRAAIDIARAGNDDALIVIAIQALLRVWYAVGDLDAVDAHLDLLDEASRRAVLPFGRVRSSFCRATNAMARGDLRTAQECNAAGLITGRELRTFAAESAARAQQALLLFERDEVDVLLPLVHAMTAGQPPSAWSAVAALLGDEQAAASLRGVADEVPVDGAHGAFVGLAAEAAARRADAALGEWCEPHLRALGDRTIVVGLGGTVLGFARHFLGHALAAQGRIDDALDEFARAADLARSSGAALWEAHSTVEYAALAAAYERDTDAPTVDRLHELLTIDAPRLRRRAGALRLLSASDTA